MSNELGYIYDSRGEGGSAIKGAENKMLVGYMVSRWGDVREGLNQLPSFWSSFFPLVNFLSSFLIAYIEDDYGIEVEIEKTCEKNDSKMTCPPQ